MSWILFTCVMIFFICIFGCILYDYVIVRKRNNDFISNYINNNNQNNEEQVIEV